MHVGSMRWQDMANVVVGAWLIISPWVLGIADDEFAEAWNAFAIGGAILLLSALALPLPGNWEEIINMGLGMWLIVSPWILEFTQHRLVTGNAVLAGTVVVALAAWALVRNLEIGGWHPDRHAEP